MTLILFMLIFYALALWDRYLKLKTKESNRLYSKGPFAHLLRLIEQTLI